MKVSERFALNEWLSDYPRDKTYDEVTDLILAQDDSVSVWQWFEFCPAAELIENIDNTRSHLECVIEQAKEEEAA